jgi:RHS repeat-associated protein
VGYEYDVDDQRVSKTVNGVVEKYIIDRNQIAYVTDGSGTQTFHYLYGTNVDSVMAQDSPTGMVWSLSDRLGSVNLLADAGGVVVNRRTFDSFGRVLSETNPSVKFRYGYTGREQDQETGLDYYRARYYDAANGRFISVDPAGFGAGDTNLYRYVGNSSTMYTDPSGEILPILALAAAFATGVELAAEAAVLFGLGAAAINVVRQDIAIAQGSSDGFKLDQFAQSAATGAAFGAATPFLSAGLLTGLGALGSGLSLLSAKNEYDNHRYGTAAFDALTAIPFGFVGKLATEKLPRISGLNGKPDPITSKELSLLNNNESLIVPNVVYGKPKGIVDIYDPIYDPQNILLSVRGQINPSLSTVSDVIKLNGIRSEAAGVAKLNNLLPGKELRSLRRGIDRNIAVADISINGSTSSIKGVSGVEDFPGFAKFIPSENRILKTMMINGRNRSQDPEAKILENILNNTRESDAIVINLATERRVCDSCLGVMRDFLLLRPNATINVTGSVIP